MIKFNQPGDGKLTKDIQINIILECSVCNETLTAQIAGNGTVVRVLPCENCLQKRQVEELERHIVDRKNTDSQIRGLEYATEIEKHKNLEDAIYKKFEDRFRRLMKEDGNAN